MTAKKRFFLGGGGALMPVLVSLLTIDIGAALASDSNLTTGNIVGLGIRYIILFVVGGVVAYLHEEETTPFKLFELGIAAPALITSLITAHGITSNSSPPPHNNAALGRISIIKSAYAGEESRPEKITLAGGFFGDVLNGISGGVYRDIGKPPEGALHENKKIIEKPAQGTNNNLIDTTQAKELPTEKSSEDPKELEKEIMLLKARLKAAKGKNERGKAAPLAEPAP